MKSFAQFLEIVGGPEMDPANQQPQPTAAPALDENLVSQVNESFNQFYSLILKFPPQVSQELKQLLKPFVQKWDEILQQH